MIPRYARLRVALTAQLLQETMGLCAYCGKPLTPLTAEIDHKVASSRGGSDEIGNLAACCGQCNRQKGDLSVDEFINLKVLQLLGENTAEYLQALGSKNLADDRSKWLRNR